MLEYVFFQEVPLKRFQDFLKEQGLVWTLEAGDMESLVVIDDLDVDDRLADRIESVYDELFALDQTICRSASAEPVHQGNNGIAVRLASGRTVVADLPPELVSRVLTAISRQELRVFVDAVVRAVEGAERQQS